MPSKTFILGAGFSADAGFPLVRNLRAEVLTLIETERHPSAKPHLTPNVHGYPQGQFYAGRENIDPDNRMGFEEWMMALRDRLPKTYDQDPAYVFQRIVRDACGRLLWQKHRDAKGLPTAYQGFGSWFHEHHSYGMPNAIISFNWDLVAERALEGAKAGWKYTIESPLVPILKPHGSINWSDHLEKSLRAESHEWQPIALGSTYCWIPGAPFLDPFESGVNQRLRKLIFPGDQEDEGGAGLIWREAEIAIRDRETVVFIGYSLPTYDAFSTAFFQRATKGKQIEVYARSPETLKSYRRTLGSISTARPIAFADCPYAKPFVEAADISSSRPTTALMGE